jgi:hypothetical protein
MLAALVKKITALTIPLIVIIVAILYFKYPALLYALGIFAINAAPAIVLFIGGILVFSRDVRRIEHTKHNQEYTQAAELNWGQSLKHDVVMFLTPILILIWPFFVDRIPDKIDVIQAAFAFVAFAYLKYLYWRTL